MVMQALFRLPCVTGIWKTGLAWSLVASRVSGGGTQSSCCVTCLALSSQLRRLRNNDPVQGALETAKESNIPE